MASDIVNMPAQGQIDREEFFLHLETWKQGERQCRVHISEQDGEPLIYIEKAELVDVNSKTGEVKIRFGEDWVLNLSSADQFRYLDYTDADEQMQECAKDGFVAWLRAYAGNKLLASLLLYGDQ